MQVHNSVKDVQVKHPVLRKWCRGSGSGRILADFLRRLLKKKRWCSWAHSGVLAPGTLMLSVMILSAAWGCAGGYSSKDKLGVALLHFNSGVRWSRHQQAAEFFLPKLRDVYLNKVEELDEKVKISEVEPLRVDFTKDNRIAKVRYRFTWHLDTEMLVRKAVIIEYWLFAGGSWQVVKVSKASGHDFPYFKGVFTKKIALADLNAAVFTKKKKPKSKSGAEDEKIKESETPKGAQPAKDADSKEHAQEP